MICLPNQYFASEAKLMAFLDKPVLKTIENDPVYLTSASIYKIAAEIIKKVKSV